MNNLNKSFWTQQFWNKVEVRGIDECWPWTGCITSSGYGSFRYIFGHMQTHRIAYLLYYGELDEDLLIRHTCDNRLCCNPRHLVKGTNYDNMQDSIERKRRWPRKGGSNNQAKLNEEAVKVIKYIRKYRTDITKQKLADLYKVDHSTVSNIIKDRTWQHIKV